MSNLFINYRLNRLQRKLNAALKTLEDLGGPIAIAKYLGDRGITGAKGKHNQCPVANYLKQEVGVEWVSVGIGQAVVNHKGLVADTEVPIHTSRFITHFDRGVLFPELESW